jgi:hypothetical protein
MGSEIPVDPACTSYVLTKNTFGRNVPRELYASAMNYIFPEYTVDEIPNRLAVRI